MSEFTINGWGKSVTVSFPDDMTEKGPEAFALVYNYEPVLIDEDENEYDNPDDEATFALNKVIGFVLEVIRQAEVQNARDLAVQTARDEVAEQMEQISVSIEEL